MFYGLTRIHLGASALQTGLTTRGKALAFASLVILPYVRVKLDALVERYKDELHEYSATSTLSSRSFKRRLIQLYSTAISIYEGLQVVQYIAYMANQSPAHSLGMRALRQHLAYLPPELDATINDWSWTDLLNGKIR